MELPVREEKHLIRTDPSRWAASTRTPASAGIAAPSISCDRPGRRIRWNSTASSADAMVIFNGHYLGRNISGYAPFRYDVTDFANYGGENTCCGARRRQPSEGWFYEGAGIYRHVWLTKTDPLHVAPLGHFRALRSSRGRESTAVHHHRTAQRDDEEPRC